jgi:hypothetical protein
MGDETLRVCMEMHLVFASSHSRPMPGRVSEEMRQTIRRGVETLRGPPGRTRRRLVCGSASRVRQPHASGRIYKLHGTATRELRYQPRLSQPAASRWTTHGWCSRYSPVAERRVLEDALVFESAEPALQFYASNRIDAMGDRHRDGSHRARLLPLMRQQIEAISAREGGFVVPRASGWSSVHSGRTWRFLISGPTRCAARAATRHE